VAYRISDLERTVLIRTLEDWLDSDRQVFGLYVDSIRGKGRTTTQTQRGAFLAEILEEVPSAEYLVDQIVDSYSDFGQRLQLRCVFVDDDGEPSWANASTKRFNLIPEAPGARSGSKGPDAATERLSQALSSGFDTMLRRQDDSQQRTLEALGRNGDQTERFFERLLELQATGANTSTTQAIALQQQVARAEMLEFQLKLVQENQEVSLGALIIEALPSILGSPLFENLSTLAGAAAARMNSEAEVTTPGALPEATPVDSAPAEA